MHANLDMRLGLKSKEMLVLKANPISGRMCNKSSAPRVADNFCQHFLFLQSGYTTDTA